MVRLVEKGKLLKEGAGANLDGEIGALREAMETVRQYTHGGEGDPAELAKMGTLLARLSDFNGFDILAVLEDDLIKLKYRSLSKVEKYAVVGARPWMRNFLELIAPLFSTKIRLFDAEEEAAAWEWVGAQQALLPE